MGPTQQKVVNWLKHRGWVYSWEVQQEVLLSYDARQALQVLHKLVNKGYLEQKRGTGYDRLGRPRKVVYQWRVKGGGR